MIVSSGLARQVALQLLSLVFEVWSTKLGKVTIAAVIAGLAVWLAFDWRLYRAYERGVQQTQAAQEAVKQEAVKAARAEGEAQAESIERASVQEQAALRELEARKLKVRNETNDETADNVLLSGDDPWLRSKRN